MRDSSTSREQGVRTFPSELQPLLAEEKEVGLAAYTKCFMGVLEVLLKIAPSLW